MSLAHPLLRSHFSFGLGTSPPAEVAEAAAAAGYQAACLADRCSLAGMLAFDRAATGLHPAFGAELPFRLPGPDTALQGWAAAIVLDRSGYAALCGLLRRLPLGADDRAMPRLDVATLEPLPGLALIAGCWEDGLATAALRAPGDAAQRLLALSRLAPGRLFLGLCRAPHSPPTEVEPALLALADRAGLPVVAVTPMTCARPEHLATSRIQRALAAGLPLDIDTVSTEPTGPAPGLLPPAATFAALFADRPDALANAAELLARATFRPERRAPRSPSRHGRPEEDQAELARLAEDGLARRLARRGLADDGRYRTRLAHELDVVARTGFAGYFLVVAELVAAARARGIPVGPGRGSGAGSLIAWALAITDIDPLRHGLLFERFLNPERVSMPDLDIDFCEERRAELLAWLLQRHGPNRVAALSTFAAIHARTALKDAARLLVRNGRPAFDHATINAITRSLPAEPDLDNLEEILLSHPNLRAHADETAVRALLHCARALLGLVRQPGTHAAGVVIADDDIAHLAPVHAPDPDDPIGLPRLGVDMRDAEALGLVKFDLLGLATLTALDEAGRFAQRLGVAVPDWETHAMDDAAVWQLLRNGDTGGVFQLESQGMRDVLCRMEPDRFEDLVAAVALYRPGPMANIPAYCARKHGEPWEPPHPALRDILAETYGIPVYQEQVMLIAQRVAGYSLGAADLLRRAMGKKIKAEMEAQRQRFVDGAVAHGTDAAKAAELFELMARFADYGFNKSHAVAYATLAYRCAWLKAHAPAAFFAAALNRRFDDRDRFLSLLEEARRRDLPLLPPDAAVAEARCTVEPGTPPAIRLGLRAVRGIGTAEAEAFLRARAALPRPLAAADLARALAETFDSRRIEALAAAGALGMLAPTRRGAALRVNALRKAKRTAEDGAAAEWEDLVERETQALGVPLSADPLAEAEAAARAFGACDPAELMRQPGETAQTECRDRWLLVQVTSVAERHRPGRQPFLVAECRGRTQRIAIAFHPSGEEHARLAARLRALAESKRVALIRVDAAWGRFGMSLRGREIRELHEAALTEPPPNGAVLWAHFAEAALEDVEPELEKILEQGPTTLVVSDRERRHLSFPKVKISLELGAFLHGRGARLKLLPRQ